MTTVKWRHFALKQLELFAQTENQVGATRSHTGRDLPKEWVSTWFGVIDAAANSDEFRLWFYEPELQALARFSDRLRPYQNEHLREQDIASGWPLSPAWKVIMAEAQNTIDILMSGHSGDMNSAGV